MDEIPDVRQGLRPRSRPGARGRALGARTRERPAPWPEALQRPAARAAADPIERPLGTAEGARGRRDRPAAGASAARNRGRLRAHRVRPRPRGRRPPPRPLGRAVDASSPAPRTSPLRTRSSSRCAPPSAPTRRATYTRATSFASASWSSTRASTTASSRSTKGPLPDADLVLEPGESLHPLLTGALDPGEAIESGRVRIEGNPELLDRFVEVFHIPPLPVPVPA